ncbi:MAG: Crp/Fnr family transcriptional regulator [Candidatus Dormibacteraceae bacterium]
MQSILSLVGTPAFAAGVDLLSLLTSAKQRKVLEGSKRVDYRAGTVAFRPGAPRAFLLDKGLVRVYMSVRDGREATVAFVHTGNMVGARNLLLATSNNNEPALTSVQAVIDSTFTLLNLENLRKLAATDIDVVGAIAMHLAERVHYDLRLVAVRTLGTVTERLAFDLLDRACKSQLAEGRLEAKATHEDLAYSIGSSREVVGRSLKQLRSEGIVEATPGKTRILDPVRLTAVVRAFVN